MAAFGAKGGDFGAFSWAGNHNPSQLLKVQGSYEPPAEQNLCTITQTLPEVLQAPIWPLPDAFKPCSCVFPTLTVPCPPGKRGAVEAQRHCPALQLRRLQDPAGSWAPSQRHSVRAGRWARVRRRRHQQPALLRAQLHRQRAVSRGGEAQGAAQLMADACPLVHRSGQLPSLHLVG